MTALRTRRGNPAALLEDATAGQEMLDTWTSGGNGVSCFTTMDGADLLGDGTREQALQVGQPLYTRYTGSRLVDICHVCGATHLLTTGTPYVRRGDAHFCPACWRQLTPREIAAVVREVALRGVPLS